MPPRYLVLVIFVFWLAMAGWLFRRDLWPQLRSDEPAPFVVTLLDEPRIYLLRKRPRNDRVVETSWTVYVNAKREGGGNPNGAMTRVEYADGDDALEFYGQFRVQAPDRKDPLVRTSSSFRVDWDGNLLGFVAQVERRPRLRELPAFGPRNVVGLLGPPPAQAPLLGAAFLYRGGALLGDDIQVYLDMEAPVQHGQLLPHWYLPGGERQDDPVPLSLRGSLLVPTHPMNRLAGLHAGQRWRLPQLNLLATVPPAPGPVICTVEAVVREDKLVVRYGGNVAVPCFLIDYEGDDRTQARTWVQQSDGLVLQQEFTYAGQRFFLERESRR